MVYEIIDPDHCGGVHQLYRFENSPYGASVIRHKHSYGYEEGLWELAVLKDGHITYNTHITDNVLGHLTANAVQEVLGQIDALGYNGR